MNPIFLNKINRTLFFNIFFSDRIQLYVSAFYFLLSGMTGYGSFYLIFLIKSTDLIHSKFLILLLITVIFLLIITFNFLIKTIRFLFMTGEDQKITTMLQNKLLRDQSLNRTPLMSLVSEPSLYSERRYSCFIASAKFLRIINENIDTINHQNDNLDTFFHLLCKYSDLSDKKIHKLIKNLIQNPKIDMTIKNVHGEDIYLFLEEEKELINFARSFTINQEKKSLYAEISKNTHSTFQNKSSYPKKRL